VSGAGGAVSGASGAVAGAGGAVAGGIQRWDGRWLSRLDGSRIARRLGAPLLVIHRADLHEILAAALPASVTVRTGVDVTAVPAEGDLVVAADGIGSVLRTALRPDVRIRESGQVAWRAVVPTPAGVAGGFGETLGRGWRFGFAPVGRRGIYWYAAGPGPLRTTSADDQLTELRTRYTGAHAPIDALLAATDPAALLHHSLADLHPVPPLRIGDRVALVGDAGHAMTPNLGQGAAQALEDAVTLVAEVAGGDVAAGLARYDAARRPRVAAMVERSRRIGAVMGARGGFTSRLRDLLVLAVPDRLAETGAARTAAWWPPSGPSGPGPEQSGPRQKPSDAGPVSRHP
jgi:2-polyprenyl-6-methoxyphenol hydroxylase-like FAD-dependent oxidoreductase